MEASVPIALSRRERQIMDIVYHRGRATAAEVMEELADPPSYNAVRFKASLLVALGFVPAAVLRDRSAAQRHLVWSVALAAVCGWRRPFDAAARAWVREHIRASAN
ncbi:MAG TPA: BlaI/MecI/CopY family transcriptional regulator [Longimicrobium sp.]